MKKYITLILCCATAVNFSSCKEEKKSDDIIVEKVVEKPQVKGTESMPEDIRNGEMSWIGGQKYTFTISRHANHNINKVNNHGQEYYDNSISLVIKRSDGTDFFNKTFTKENFSPVLPQNIYDSGVLLSLRFDKAEGNNVYFVVTVGSPDENLDEFYYVTLKINNFGNSSAEKNNM